jgi:hypothetical protein
MEGDGEFRTIDGTPTYQFRRTKMKKLFVGLIILTVVFISGQGSAKGNN